MKRNSISILCGLALLAGGMAACGGGETKQTADTVIEEVKDTAIIEEVSVEENFIFNDTDTATLAMLNQLTVIDGLSRPSELYENKEGLKYRILQEGTGNKAAAGDSIVYNIQSMKTNGEKMENTFFNSPSTAVLDEATFGNGLLTGIQEMTPGSIYEFFIPAALSGKNADVICVVELKEVK